MRQITKFDELPEDVKATWSSVYTSGMDSMVASYNAGLRDGGERPPLTEVPEHVLKALANVAGAWDIKQILAALNADRAGEQPAETPAPAAEIEMKRRDCANPDCPCNDPTIKKSLKVEADQAGEMFADAERECRNGLYAEAIFSMIDELRGRDCAGEIDPLQEIQDNLNAARSEPIEVAVQSVIEAVYNLIALRERCGKSRL